MKRTQHNPSNFLKLNYFNKDTRGMNKQEEKTLPKQMPKNRKETVKRTIIPQTLIITIKSE